ncbi:hypothetical protein F4820DRAFT_204727 [Hypoxylon rubiginosum]|uniref:Uncharacterized protein n=1 Tax=Hypoxylon rubiginosum TaxID=110542 RepID=A0ACB9YH43_9PEZI|nr:hypothetical protein F4820DRAFT_204727 [Hypoxylon rubiginosum]
MSQHLLRAFGLSLLLSLMVVDAAPADGGVNPFNTLGTSLTDFTGCKTDKDNNEKDFINQAYKEAHTIVNVDGVKANIHWDSEAAVDFFGPAQFNKDQQAQIQAVLANIETVQPGYWFNPFGHSLQVRCDNPKNNCGGGVTAYTVNPTGNEKPYVNFCPGFFRQYTLDKAVNAYKDDKNPEIKWNVDNYMNRGLVFLHELFHVDMAADSEKGTPNPKIFDIKIRYEDPKGEPKGPLKAYTARYSKLLARFLPSNKGKNPKSTGYWVQRNVDNFSRYAMAKYLEGKIGGYPFLPLIYDKLLYPLIPDPRPGKSSVVAFQADKNSDAKVDVDTSDIDALDGEADVDSTHTTDEVFEVGQPIGVDEYPESYKKAYAGWLDILQGKSDGTCKVQVKEIWTCEDAASNLYASVQITDASGKTVYTTPGSAHSPGQPINDGHPLKLKESGMDNTLTMVGEHTNDYIQFSYGSTSWTSNDTKSDASCKLVGDNWDKNGPKGCPNAMAVTRTFECQYPCGK